MSDIKVVEYNGVLNSYKEIEVTESWAKIRKKDRCPLCKKNPAVGEIVYLMINNCVLFPNKVVHKNCVAEIGMTEAIRRIKASWDKEAERRKQPKIW